MLVYQDNFLNIDIDRVESPYLRNLIEERGGQIDDYLRDLIKLEKYMRGIRPGSAMLIIRMMISGIAHTYPLEAEIMRRELESGKAVDPAERDAIKKNPPKPIEDFDLWINLRGRDRAKTHVQDGAVQLSKNSDN